MEIAEAIKELLGRDIKIEWDNRDDKKVAICAPSNISRYNPGRKLKPIGEVVKRAAEHCRVDLSERFSKRAKLVRVANRLLRRVRDWAQVKAQGKITIDVTDKALVAQGIDNLGLDNIDRKVLKAIIEFYDGGPVGIESLAATLNEESDTIVDIVEPFLLKIGFLKRTPRGREATKLAYQHLGISGSKKSKQKELF